MQSDPNYVATYDAQPIYFRWKSIRTFGWILALMASTTLALGIADVALTINSYNCQSGCKGEPYVWTWVAIGIWASVPVLIAAMLAMCLGSNPVKLTKYFALFIYLSAIVFLPGMITLSSIEIWRGSVASPNFYTVPSQVVVGSLTPNPASAVNSKFGIPVAIAVIGFVMFLMTAFMTLVLCFCMQELGIYRPKEVETYDGYQWTTMLPAQTQVIPAPVVTRYDQPDDIGYNVPRPRPKFQNIIYNDQSINQGFNPSSDMVYQPRRQFLNQYTPGPMAPPMRRPLPTRYTNTSNAYGIGGLYGNFSSSQQVAQPTSYVDDFVKPYMTNFWK